MNGHLDSDVKNALRDLPSLLSRRQAARLLGVSEHTISRWVSCGRLHAVKTHPSRQGRVRIPKAAIQRFLMEGAD